MSDRLHRGCAVALLGLALLGAGALRAQTAPPKAAADRIRRVEQGLLPASLIAGRPLAASRLADRMAALDVPAVSIAVVDHGAIAWARGYGEADVARHRQTDTLTLFQAASISKPVTAAAALRLTEEGRITLDGDVNQWLTSWHVPENAFTRAHPVTLRELLSHSAGVTVHGFAGYDPRGPVPTLRQVLDSAPPANSSPIRVDTTPGAMWRYSGGGYTIVQQLLIDVTGKSFPEWLTRTVLEPARMARSGYDQPLPVSRAASAATGYRAGGTPVEGNAHVYPELAAAGLWTTPSDLARFGLELTRALNGRSRMLTRASARLMITPEKGDWGLGLEINGAGDSLRFNHGGANEGFRCLLVMFPATGQGAAIMTNSDAGGELIAPILRAIAHEYRWPAFEPPTRSIVVVDSVARHALAGSYAIDGGISVIITAIGDSLAFEVPGHLPRQTIYPSSPSTYFTTETDLELAVQSDSSLAITYGGQTFHARRSR